MNLSVVVLKIYERKTKGNINNTGKELVFLFIRMYNIINQEEMLFLLLLSFHFK